MHRCLELALSGAGHVAPNPMVGSVLVHDGRIIGEGFHAEYGRPHAEVNCIHAVKEEDKSLISSSTLYVSLEPCAHFGKTPPCSDLIIQHKIPEVIIGCRDPFKQVNGKGIEKLQAAGVKVTTGVLEKEARMLNKRFIGFHQQHRPYIILKWAQTADGFIARSNYNSQWISNSLSRKLVHRWRSEEPAVMVGTNTAHYDNPRLNVRDWTGDDPIRIVVDRNLRLSPSLHLFDQSQTTLCYNLLKEEAHEYVQYIRCTNQTQLLPQIVEDLYKRKVQSVLIEGGLVLLQQCIDWKLWDEIRVFTATQTFSEGIRAPHFGGRLLEKTNVNGDELAVFVK